MIVYTFFLSTFIIIIVDEGKNVKLLFHSNKNLSLKSYFLIVQNRGDIKFLLAVQ